MLVETKKLNKKEMIVVSSRDVADTFEKEHKEVIRSIEGQKDADGKTKHLGLIEQIEQGGELPFEKYFIPSEYKSNGRSYREYLMTRDGFTLLVMGFSGEKAMKFKLAYIKQFNQMEELLKGKVVEREKGIAIRQALTKAIEISGENERMHGHAYSTYTNLIYKSIFGKDAKRLREEYGISKKGELRGCFSTEELQQVQKAEMLVSSLVEYGWGCDEIKDFIQNKISARIAA